MKPNPMDRTPPLTPRALAQLGLQHLAYIRQVRAEEGAEGYMICAADGTPLGIAERREGAIAAVRQHGLEPVSVH